MDKTPRFIIVELYDDAWRAAADAAREIIDGGSTDIKSAYPAYDDGHGRLVRAGPIVEAKG